MARKIGDLVMGIIILLLVGGGLSFFLNSADSATGTTSGVYDDLSEITGAANEYQTLETETTERLFDTGDFIIEADTQVENRGTNVVGIVSLFQNNILTRLQSLVSEKLNIHPYIITMLSSLIFFTIAILTIRFFWGENKV